MNKITIDELLEYDFISNVLFSPDGKHLAFNVHNADKEENDYLSKIWIYNLEEEEMFQLTNADKDKGFVWLNDGEILFTSDRDGEEKEDEKEKKKEETKLFKININGGEAQHFDTLKKKVTGMRYEEGTLLLTIKEKIEDQGTENEGDEEETEDWRIEGGKDYHELDEVPFWVNGDGFSNKERNHLYSYSIEDKELELLVGDHKDVEHFDFDGEKISLTITEYENVRGIVNQLYLYDLKEDGLKQITDEEWKIGRSGLLNGKVLFEASDMEAMGVNTNKDFFIYDPEKEEYSRKTEMDKSLANSILTDIRYGGGQMSKVEDGYYYFTATERDRVVLYRYSLEDGMETVIDERGSIDLFDVKDDRVAFVGLKGLRPQEIYLLNDLEEKSRRITEFNDLDKKMSEPERFTIESNGKKIDVWVMKPTDYEDGEEYPTVFQIHGGPKAAYSDVHFHEFQVLASEGYAIIYSNPLGSAGKGDDFADIITDYGSEDYEDMMNVLDEALERYDFFDEERIGVTGGSYGGYMTNWIVGHTDRFKAGVSCRSISNWLSKFGETDIGYYFVPDQFGTTPWDDEVFLWERSPLKYADQVDTPLLLIHSREDFRCYEGEAIQMFTALKYHDVPSKLVLFEGENHDLSRSGRPQQRMKRLEEKLNWFDEYLK